MAILPWTWPPMWWVEIKTFIFILFLICIHILLDNTKQQSDQRQRLRASVQEWHESICECYWPGIAQVLVRDRLAYWLFKLFHNEISGAGQQLRSEVCQSMPNSIIDRFLWFDLGVTGRLWDWIIDWTRIHQSFTNQFSTIVSIASNRKQQSKSTPGIPNMNAPIDAQCIRGQQA